MNFNFKLVRQQIPEQNKLKQRYHQSNFWRTGEMSSINCETNLFLTWSVNCVMVSADVDNQNATFEITVTTLYVTVVTLSTQCNAKLLQQFKSGFKRTINWNKYLSELKIYIFKSFNWINH